MDRGSQCSSVVRPRGKLQDSQAPWIVTVPTHKLLDVFIEIDFFFYRKYTHLKSVLSYTPIERSGFLVHVRSALCVRSEDIQCCRRLPHALAARAPKCQLLHIGLENLSLVCESFKRSSFLFF